MDDRLDDYQHIALAAIRLYDAIPDYLKDAYYQLVYYPVLGAELMNEKIFYARKSLYLAANKDKKALEYAQKSVNAYDQIQELTRKYNEQIANGKWNGIMSSHPRNLSVFKMPEIATETTLSDTVNIEKLLEEAKIGQEDKTIKIEASDYFNKSESNDRKLNTITGLGLDGEGITVFPFTALSITEENISSAPFAEYKVNLASGTHKITVKCLPTHAIYKGRFVRYAVSVNNDLPQIFNLNSPAESKVWKQNVLRGYSMGETSHTISKDGEAIIRIYLPDPGVVINRIEIE